MYTQNKKRTRQQKIEATQKRVVVAPDQSAGTSYSFQGKGSEAKSRPIVAASTPRLGASIFRYDHRLIYKDLLRTAITTLFIFGILIGVWQYLT